MRKHTDRPSTGYFVEVDCIGGIADVRKELRGTGVHAVELHANGPAGCPLLRLTAATRRPLAAFLLKHDYDPDANEIVNARHA